MDFPHTLLLTGGTAETRRTTAYEIARETIPCEDLSQCSDFLELDSPESNSIGIEEARHLKEWTATKPLAQKKVIYIHNAEKLTVEAQNALLKILEEPPEGSQIILSAQKSTLLLPTVLSRCAKQELTNQYDFSNLIASSSEIVTLLKAPLGERFDWCAEHLKLFKDDVGLTQKIEEWLIVLRDLLMVKEGSASGTKGEGSLNLPTLEDTRQTATAFETADLLEALNSITAILEKIEKTPVERQLLLEVTLLSLPSPAVDAQS